MIVALYEAAVRSYGLPVVCDGGIEMGAMSISYGRKGLFMQKREYMPSQWLEFSDGVLVREVLAGNQIAFEALVERYHTMLYRFIYHHLGEYDQACDVLQQVFLKLYIALPTLPAGDQLKPWLFRVAQNCCRDELRKRRRRRVTLFSAMEFQAEEDEMPSLFSIPDTLPLPEEIAEYHDLQSTLQQAIQALPIKFRSVVLLRYLYQCSFSEIGQMLEMPMTTAKTYYYRACTKLRASLKTR